MVLTKVFDVLRRKQETSKNADVNVKVYVTPNGSLYVKGHDLAHNAAWRAKVKELIDADLTGRNKPERDD